MEFKKRVKQMLQEEGGRLKNVFKKGKERRKNKFIVLNFCPLLGHPPCGLQKSGSNFKHYVGLFCFALFAFQVFHQKHHYFQKSKCFLFSLNCFFLAILSCFFPFFVLFSIFVSCFLHCSIFKVFSFFFFSFFSFSHFCFTFNCIMFMFFLHFLRMISVMF